MAALPYMQLYVADYLADTAHLSTIEHGAYLLLMFNYWQRGESFKAKDEQSLNRRLATVARLSSDEWEDVKETLAEFFDVSEKEWLHRRIERDLKAVNEKSTKAKAAGRASGQKRATTAKPSPSERSTDAGQTLNHTEADTDTEERIGGPAATTPPCVREEAPNAAPDSEHSGSADRPTPDATPNRAAQLSVLLRRNGADPRTKPNDRHLADWVAAGVTDSQVLQALDTAKARRAAASSTQPIGTPYLTPIIAELRSPGGGKSHGAKTPAQRRSDWTQELNQTLAHLTGDTSSEPEFHDLGDFDATGHPV